MSGTLQDEIKSLTQTLGFELREMQPIEGSPTTRLVYTCSQLSNLPSSGLMKKNGKALCPVPEIFVELDKAYLAMLVLDRGDALAVSVDNPTTATISNNQLDRFLNMLKYYAGVIKATSKAYSEYIPSLQDDPLTLIDFVGLITTRKGLKLNTTALSGIVRIAIAPITKKAISKMSHEERVKALKLFDLPGPKEIAKSMCRLKQQDMRYIDKLTEAEFHFLLEKTYSKKGLPTPNRQHQTLTIAQQHLLLHGIMVDKCATRQEQSFWYIPARLKELLFALKETKNDAIVCEIAFPTRAPLDIFNHRAIFDKISQRHYLRAECERLPYQVRELLIKKLLGSPVIKTNNYLQLFLSMLLDVNPAVTAPALPQVKGQTTPALELERCEVEIQPYLGRSDTYDGSCLTLKDTKAHHKKLLELVIRIVQVATIIQLIHSKKLSLDTLGAKSQLPSKSDSLYEYKREGHSKFFSFAIYHMCRSIYVLKTTDNAHEPYTNWLSAVLDELSAGELPSLPKLDATHLDGFINIDNDQLELTNALWQTILNTPITINEAHGTQTALNMIEIALKTAHDLDKKLEHKIEKATVVDLTGADRPVEPPALKRRKTGVMAASRNYDPFVVERASIGTPCEKEEKEGGAMVFRTGLRFSGIPTTSLADLPL